MWSFVLGWVVGLKIWLPSGGRPGQQPTWASTRPRRLANGVTGHKATLAIRLGAVAVSSEFVSTVVRAELLRFFELVKDSGSFGSGQCFVCPGS